MTVTTNATTITVKHGKTVITCEVTEVTELVTALLAARKEAYGNARSVRTTAKAERTAALAAKKQARLEAKTARVAARKAKLEAELAKLAA